MSQPILIELNLVILANFNFRDTGIYVSKITWNVFYGKPGDLFFFVFTLLNNLGKYYDYFLSIQFV